MSIKNSTIAENFYDGISTRFIQLVDSERGIQTKLAKSIGKKPTFINSVKQNRPVNALHLKAVELVFGPQKVIELISGNEVTDGIDFAQNKIERLETENRKLTEVLEITSKAKDTLALILKEVHGADEAQVSEILTGVYEKMKPLDIAGFKMINDLQNRVELLENQIREIWRILEKHQPKDGVEKRQSWKEFKRVVEPLIKEMEEVQG
jgi:hypothetical protein